MCQLISLLVGTFVTLYEYFSLTLDFDNTRVCRHLNASIYLLSNPLAPSETQSLVEPSLVCSGSIREVLSRTEISLVDFELRCCNSSRVLSSSVTDKKFWGVSLLDCKLKPTYLWPFIPFVVMLKNTKILVARWFF